MNCTRSTTFASRARWSSSKSEGEARSTASKPSPKGWRGKTQPVSVFSGENLEIWLSEWLPSLKQAARWNDWDSEEQVLQLAGHHEIQSTSGVESPCRG